MNKPITMSPLSRDLVILSTSVISAWLKGFYFIHYRILVQSWPRYVYSIHSIGNVYDLYNNNNNNN